jgi:hypothetical protein
MKTFNRLHYLLPLVAGALVACGSSGPTKLTITGSGFSAVEGKPVKLGLVDVSGKKVAQTSSTTVSGGKFEFDLTVDAGVTYRADLYADDNGDGHCQWGVDHVYAVDVTPISEGTAVTKTVVQDAVDSRGCLSFGASSLHVTVTNLASGTTGTVFEAALVKCADATCAVSGGKVAGLYTGSVSGSMIDFLFDGGIVPGVFYRVDLFVNNNPTAGIKCDASDTIVTGSPNAVVGAQTDGLTGQKIDLAIDGSKPANMGTVAICTASFP